TFKILTDAKRPFPQRFAAVRTLRFYHGWKPEESKAQILRGYGALVEDGDNADMPIEDLRKWKMWELTAKILTQFGKPSHDAPITRRAIARYALSCPLPEAREFVNRVRTQDPRLIEELKESLEFEQRK